MLENQAKGFYLNWLGPKSGTKQKLQILRNLLFHFSEDEARWKERHGDNEGTYIHKYMYVFTGTQLCMTHVMCCCKLYGLFCC